MYPVTEQWKIDAELRSRNPSYVRIVFGITDPDAPNLSTITDNGHLSYSSTGSVGLGLSVPASYQTLEKNRFVLDGKNPLPDCKNPIYQGYVGYEMSGLGSYYFNAPTLTISFSDYVQFPGLTFQFDESMNEYPINFRIGVYKDNVLVYEKEYHPNTAYWSLEEQIPICNKLKLIWDRSNIDYRRARLGSLIFGLVNRIENDEVANCTSTKEIDLLSSKIPKQAFDFTLIDTERRYDPENPSGLWEYLESRQPVTYYYGYELSDGGIEWIPWGMSYSTGDFEVTKQGSVSEVSIKCVGLADHLTDIYDEGTYSNTGKSLYTLATEVMEFAGYQNAIELDEALKTLYTHNPLPSQTVRECLQLIANAGRCIMSHSRGGSIQILRENQTEPNFAMTFTKMTNTPTTSKIPPLRYLSTNYTSITLEDTVSEAVSEVQVVNATAQEFTFTHQGYTNQTIILSSDLTMTGTAKFFAYKTVVTLTGTGTVTIKGNRLIENTAAYKKKYSDIGQDLDNVSNYLVDNLDDVKAYADWLAECTLRRSTYSVSDRGYPELDVGDSVTFTSNFKNEVPTTIIQQKLTYNGAIKGEGQYVIGSDTK